MKFTVKRSKWLRGVPDYSALRVSGGKQCCVGFYARELGYSTKEILGVAGLSDVLAEQEKFFLKKPRHPETIMAQIYGCNDDLVIGRLPADEDEYDLSKAAKKLIDERRETKLTKLFQKIGVTVKFVD